MGLRYGRVSSVDASRHTAQVAFEEGDGFVSWDLPVLAVRPGDYSLPPADALVACFLEDDNSGTGVVLGCLYSDEDAAPSSDEDARLITSDAGAVQTMDEDGNVDVSSSSGKKVSLQGGDLNIARERDALDVGTLTGTAGPYPVLFTYIPGGYPTPGAPTSGPSVSLAGIIANGTGNDKAKA